MSNLIGQTLGPYRIIEQIGIGGMATVYKAYQPSMDRYVAIKVLPAIVSRDPAFLKRFRREAKVVAKLEHKHILPVHDYGEQEGLTYLVMRYIEAGTLKDHLAAGQLDLPTIYRIIAQVGAALDYAHRLGVIHRDVKPTNVLIDSQGDAYLTDFGLARIMESSEQLTATGVGVGTPAYMAPEQGQGLKIDHRSDVYSLGVMLYEMVTGQVPYQAETPMAVVLKHITEPLTLPRKIVPDLPEEVERVILKALAKNPDDRFQTVREMVEALDLAVRAATAAPTAAWVEGEVVPPVLAAPARKFRWPWDVRTTALGVGIAALALLVIGGMFFALSRIQYRVQVVGGRVEVVPVSTEAVTPTPAVALVETSTSEVALGTPTATATPTRPAPTATATLTPPSTATPTPTGTATPPPTSTATSTPTSAATPRPTPVPSLSGRVTDVATGQGMGGAKVEAQLAGHGWDYSTTTASDGGYALFGLPAGDYKVRVTALGHAREYYDNVNPSHEATHVHFTAAQGTSGINFDLTEDGSISGHIYQSDGVAPIGGARISVWPSKYAWDDGFHVTTTADGSYSVTGLALGNYKVQVEAPGYAKEYYDEVYCYPEALDVMVIPPDDTPNTDIRLDQAGSISGYVFESDGSTPVSGAQVCAEFSPGRDCLGLCTRSNADGSYTIVNLPPADYTVKVSAPGFGFEFYDAKSSYKAADVIPVAAGSDTPGISFTLDVGGAVTGHVYDENGTPISGVEIGADLLTGDSVGTAGTQPDGSYRLWLKTGSYLIGVAGLNKAPGYVPEWYNDHYDASNADPVQVTAPSETSGIDFYLAKAGSISGHVYEEDGTTPIAGASVYAFPTTGDHPGAGANSEPDSSYTIEGLPSGSYKVQATVSGHVAEYYDNAPDEASATEVTVNAPDDTPGIDFALSPVSG